jgi:hypothetical protein
MRTSTLAWLVTALAAASGSAARADVRSLTLGITMNCPYGLAG